MYNLFPFIPRNVVLNYSEHKCIPVFHRVNYKLQNLNVGTFITHVYEEYLTCGWAK